MPFDPAQLKTFTTRPGVYLMKNKRGVVLYVGKANNLRQRLRQYFVAGGDGRPMIPLLVPQIEEIETIVVTSEKEALLLENNLIKQHLPKYNALLKDDKSYIALKVNNKHQWPMLKLVRYRGRPEPDGLYFGPYTSAYAARQTLDLLQKLFPLRQCSDQEFARRTRPCILYDMKRCIAPCVGRCTQEEYDGYVRKTVRFLRGQDKEVLKELYHEMEQYAEQLEYERAGAVLKMIRMIEKTVEGQLVDKPLGGDADVLGIFRQAGEVVLCQMMFRAGRLTGVRHYDFVNIMEDDTELFETFLLQHYPPLQELPHEILTPIPVNPALAEILGTDRPRKVTLHTPQKGDKLSLLKMAALNAEATFKKEKDENTIREKRLLAMQEKFRLSQFPRRIECFDTSNIAGTEPVAALIAFTNGQKESSRYRKYKVKTTDVPDDYGAMAEVLMRRYKRAKEENDLPDLLIVDGGKGQLNVALKVMQELNIITVDVISLAKEEGRHDRGMTAERVFLPNVKDPVQLKRNSPVLFLLQQIRDEAHRFAITFHRKRRSKKLLKSALDEIPGIGPAKKKALLRTFGSVKKIFAATDDELAAVPGITRANITALRSHTQK